MLLPGSSTPSGSATTSTASTEPPSASPDPPPTPRTSCRRCTCACWPSRALVTGSDDLGYLLRVLRNTFISGRRTAARRPATATAPEDFERFEASGAGPERAVEVRELYAGIAELPDHQRDALVAVDLLGLSYKEAAASLKVPTGTIMSRLFRARQALAAA